MKLGLLGLDECSLRLAAAAQAAGHELVARWQEPDSAPRSAPILNAAPVLSEWDQLLTVPHMDGVIVASAVDDADPEATRMAPLRSLAQAGFSALVCHPFVPSTIAHYELDMACEESGARLIPFTTWRWDPAVAQLQNLFGEGPLGKLKHISIERRVPDDRRETLSRQFAIDLDLVRLLIGDVVRLHAMTTVIPVGDVLSGANNPAKDPHWPNLGIQVVGSSGAAGRWLPQASSSADQSRAAIQATGEHGIATLTVWPRASLWDEQNPSKNSGSTLAWSYGETTTNEVFADNAQIESAAIADFAAAVGGQTSQASWADACHAMHAAESIGRSLKRGRVIDLNYDDYSEEGTFKGLMAAGGCLVLLAALVILTAGVMLGKFGWKGFDKLVPFVLLFLLAGFLALQFLGAVFRGDKDSNASDSSGSGPPLPPAP